MTTDFRNLRPAADSSRLHGEEGRLRRTQTLLDGTEDELLEAKFALPSARAETGALLERQLLISGGLEDTAILRHGRDGGSRRIGLIFGVFVLAVAGAGSAFYVQHRKMQEELQAELGARTEEIAASRADNERLVLAQRETGLRLEKTAAELSREVAEKRRITREAEEARSELELVHKDVAALRTEIGGLTERNRKLEAQRLAELGAFLRAWLLSPMKRLLSLTRSSATTVVGPIPRATPLVKSQRTFTQRAAASAPDDTARGRGAPLEGEAPGRADGPR